MAGASKPVDVSTKQQRIAELAQQSPEMGFTSLAYFIDLDWLLLAYEKTRKDGAVGVDGQDGEAYAADLLGNLQSLLNRAKSGTYHAPPVRRVHIPKAGSATETRPLGIPTFEDKVLQRAVVMVREALYEQDFKDCSYGFRPGRSAHQALASLRQQTMAMGGGWIVDVDIRKFFDTIDHGHLRDFLKRRMRDGVLLRLIGKWLNAGVFLTGEPHDEIVRVADQERSPLEAGLDLPLEPIVQHIVQEDVREDRADHTPLRRPLLRVREAPVLEDARVEPFTDQS